MPKTSTSSETAHDQAKSRWWHVDAHMSEWRRRLLDAKADGADDRTAAEYARLTEEQFDRWLKDDPALERDMRSARAEALIDHLVAISNASQWQAHEFLLEKLWPDCFATIARDGDSARTRAMREAVHGLTPEQVKDLAKIISLGAATDNGSKPPPPTLEQREATATDATDASDTTGADASDGCATDAGEGSNSTADDATQVNTSDRTCPTSQGR